MEESSKALINGQKLDETLSSPTSAVSQEETRILREHMSQQNMFKLIDIYEPHRKALTLKKFFKMKRNQQVVISPIDAKDTTIDGKVTAIGRDFVMITNLQKRIWLPYTAIESVTIPFGVPTYSNSHQHHIYDNQLQRKIVLKFGETIHKKDALVQQFFEETLRTNLNSWRGTWVEVKTAKQSFFGKIRKTDRHVLFLKLLKVENEIPLNDIQSATTVRLFSLWRRIIASVFKKTL